MRLPHFAISDRQKMHKAARHAPWLTMTLVGLLSGCGADTAATPTAAGRTSRSSESFDVPKRSEASAPTGDSDEPSVPDPSPSEPVTAVMTLRPASVSAGETFELLVSVRIAGGHFVHTGDDPRETFVPLGMDLTLPEGVDALGDWQLPTPDLGRGNDLVYRKSVELRRSLKVASTAPAQSLVITGALRYQACNDELCWPPGKLELSVPLIIRSPAR